MKGKSQDKALGKVISVANLKGGVGKTTTAIMLAEGLSLQEAAEGGRRNRVLVIDADPQASLGFALAGAYTVKGVAKAHSTINALMMRALMHGLDIDVGACIVPGIARVHGSFAGKTSKTDISLLASSPQMIFADHMLIRDMTVRGLSYDETAKQVFDFIKKRILGHARKHFDWTIIDCAPGMNMLTRASLCAGDATVVTVVPEPMASFGFDLFLNYVWAEHSGPLPKPKSPLVLLTRVSTGQIATRVEIRRIEHAVEDAPPARLLAARVPEAAAMDGQWFMKPVLMSLAGRYKSPLAKVIVELADEVREIVHDA